MAGRWSASMEEDHQAEARWTGCKIWASYFQAQPHDEIYTEQTWRWRGNHREPSAIRCHTQRWWRYHHTSYRVAKNILHIVTHLLQALLLFFCEIGWQCHVICYNKIANAAIAPVVAFATQPHLGAILCLGFHL